MPNGIYEINLTFLCLHAIVSLTPDDLTCHMTGLIGKCVNKTIDFTKHLPEIFQIGPGI